MGKRQEKIWKGPRLSQRCSDSRTFGRSKFPKWVAINPLNARKQSQWESPIMTHPDTVSLSLQPTKSATLLPRNTGGLERNTCYMLPPRISKRWESHPQSRWFKFQASCCFNYKFLVLIVFGIFRTTFFACDVWSLLRVFVVISGMTVK